MSESKPHCPGCGSQQLEKLVLVLRKVKYGPFLKDQVSCPWREDCLNVVSQRCRFCHRKVIVTRHMLSEISREILRFTDSSDNWRHFKAKEA
jgi:hypothetical protein